MDMAVRRRIFLALFGKDYHSLDHMAAYALSVNAVINVGRRTAVRQDSLSGAFPNTRGSTGVYFDVMREMGKS